MTPRWQPGNQVELLENGDEFYPRVFQAIDRARREVIIETFILREDHIGSELAARLIRAAQRGIRAELTVDAWGSMALSDTFIGGMTSAGVCVHIFEEKRPRWLLRVSWFRRLHRKLVVIDGDLAFIGGINFSADHLTDYGPEAKQDYAVQVEGPVTADIHDFAIEAIESVHGRESRAQRFRPSEEENRSGNPGALSSGPMLAMFLARDNRRGNRTTIEKHYRAAIRLSQHRLVIANAYFFPGHLLLREIRNAARRGVDVSLIMQAEPDIRLARFAGRLLYDYLLEGGVRILEYNERQFHGKVALIDDVWVTVGSSNLDPLSLWFNLEANIFIRDETFNRTVGERIATLIDESCREIRRAQSGRRVFWRPAVGFVAFHLLRKFPRVAGLLPAHRPRLTRVPAPDPLKHGAG